MTHPTLTLDGADAETGIVTLTGDRSACRAASERLHHDVVLVPVAEYRALVQDAEALRESDAENDRLRAEVEALRHPRTADP